MNSYIYFKTQKDYLLLYRKICRYSIRFNVPGTFVAKSD